MCNKKILSKIRSGELSMCEQCNIYHLTFNNIYFEFNEKQFYQFRNYISNIDIEYWEKSCSCSSIKRKIPLQTLHQNLVLIFSKQEVIELNTLFAKSTKNKLSILNVDDIDYMLILN